MRFVFIKVVITITYVRLVQLHNHFSTGTSSPTGSGEILNCVCVQGCTDGSNRVECTVCVMGKYKATTSSGFCKACPGGATSPMGSIDEEACSFIDGHFLIA